ncbi:MAG: RES family NAD+ phosphorylase [Myxococcota bacterium]
MPKFPEPPAPAALAAIGADVRLVPAGTELWRVYFQGGRHPTTWDQFRSFGPTSARFDPHLPPPGIQPRKVLYGAAEGPTCVAGVFQETRVIDRTVNDPALVGFAAARGLRLLDLTATWPTRAGASMAINSGTRLRAQRWARAIYDAFPDLDGIAYASFGNAPAVALFERAEDVIPDYPFFHRRLDDPVLDTVLRNVAARVGYLLS